MSDDDYIITTQWGSKARSFAALSDNDRRGMMQNCADLMSEIKAKTGIDVYLSYGCLLGAVRSGKMISHDFDIDLGFHAKGQTKEDIVLECRKLIRYLSRTCHRVVVESNGQFKAAKMFADGTYMTIEFFVSWAERNNFFLYFGIPGAKIANKILPLGEIEIEGVKMPAPKNPSVMVEALYGQDWRTPNPNFQYDNINWTPFQGFSVNKNMPYWDDYYTKNTGNDIWAEFPSQFGAFCATEIEAGSRLLDFACGNGRDSLFFSQLGHDVLACDYSKAAVELVKMKRGVNDIELEGEILNVYDTASVQKIMLKYSGKFDIIYSRFAMHAITFEGQDRFLRLAKRLLNENGKVLLEFRNSNDLRMNDGEVLSDDERLDGHYRRFINRDEFIINVTEVGLNVVYIAEGTGFAKFKDEDPNVTRVILTR